MTVDARKGVLNLDISDAEMKDRMVNWKQPELRYKTGVIAKYCRLVANASEGAVTRA